MTLANGEAIALGIHGLIAGLGIVGLKLWNKAREETTEGD